MSYEVGSLLSSVPQAAVLTWERSSLAATSAQQTSSSDGDMLQKVGIIVTAVSLLLVVLHTALSNASYKVFLR